MLLRLLPVPSASQPCPPTILFTLPLPTNPYTSRALPLPPNLLAHRSLCLQEDIDCTNVLLGDKASWVWGVVDDVTFSLPQSAIIVHLVDGSTITLDLSSDCIATLHRVVNEVQLSFAAAAAPPPPPVAVTPADSPRTSTSSDASSSSSLSPASAAAGPSGSRRSPSSLLFSLLSPLLPTGSPNPARPQPPAHVAVHQQPARAHRRQARSLLVDAYRRHVLPALKERVPSAYLLWAIQSETATKMDEYAKLREEINAVLEASGINLDMNRPAPVPLQRCNSNQTTTTTSSFDSPESSDMDCDELGGMSSPQSFLLAIPPAHAIPSKHRAVYSQQLTRLTQLASRVGSIVKLAGRYEREEGKRKWLEELELQRDAEKACRRAFSNGLLPRSSTLNALPLRRSGLCHSITAEEVARAAEPKPLASLSTIEDLDELLASDDDSCSSCSDCSDDSASSPPARENRKVKFADDDDTPHLIPSRSDDSLSEREDWEPEQHEQPPLPSLPPVWDAKHLPPLPATPTWSSLEVF
ncbi:hypothetical protein VHUM_01729 [Vanrija humicola]|uniref:Uncharacterized protein n=1 Tax=Vanrija humicola TaxID=5417 RepID=A0A7D8YX81_VANHU|nr:hypothetical protein VHUM_01729 [Vanrija humicola]